MGASQGSDPTSTLWAQKGSYPPRPGNEVQILIDGQAAYSAIASAFHQAKKFIYLTISFADLDFLLVPQIEETLIDILRSRSDGGIDVRMVVWQPALHTPDTIPDPAPNNIPGVNDGTADSIQARWDKAPGFKGRYTSVLDLFDPKDIAISAEFGCHHQKTYITDDGGDGWVAFVGGINPVQTYWDTPNHDSLDTRRVEWKYPYPLKWLEKNPPLHDIFYQIKGPAVGDVLANFVERFNGASIPYAHATALCGGPGHCGADSGSAQRDRSSGAADHRPENLPGATGRRPGDQGVVSERLDDRRGRKFGLYRKPILFRPRDHRRDP